MTSVLLVAQQLRRSAPGGIGTYTAGLTAAARSIDGGPIINLLASAPPARPDPMAQLAPVTASRLPAPLLVPAWSAGLVKAPAGHDLVHACSLAFPAPRPTVPLVVAVHDAAWRHVPDSYPAHGRRWHERALARARRQATAIVVPTAALADELRRDPGSRARIEPLTPMYGCDHLPAPADDDAAARLERLGVGGTFVLSVGTLQPRKNLPRVFSAYSRARPRLGGAALVVVGPSGWGPATAPVEGVAMAGEVEPAVLAALYRRASCLVYAPLQEGWGLPPVEAMDAGLPVVASPMPSTGAAALEVDPTDVDAIADAIVTAACDDVRRGELRQAGKARAAELTWAAVARAHVELWETVL